jgi:hypothetical protein
LSDISRYQARQASGYCRKLLPNLPSSFCRKCSRRHRSGFTTAESTPETALAGWNESGNFRFLRIVFEILSNFKTKENKNNYQKNKNENSKII